MKIVNNLRRVKVDLCFRFRQWFLRPLKREDELNDRLDVVTFFTNHRNVEAVTSIQTCLKDIRNLEVKVIFRSLLYEVQNLIFFKSVVRGVSLWLCASTRLQWLYRSKSAKKCLYEHALNYRSAQWFL